MPDHLTPAQRHLVMSHIRSRNTKPELKVRQWLWAHGYRYRLNVKSVPGKPDIVMRKYRTAIFVNGCFWHGHGVTESPVKSYELKVKSWDLKSSACCKIPSTNREFWVNKIRRNQERDQKNYQVLLENGWQVIVIWECQLKPKRIEQTMTQVELLLNEKLLSLYSHHVPFHYQTEEESSLPMAAEELNTYEFVSGGKEKK